MSIKFIQLPTCRLAEFVSSSATSFDVSGFLYNDGTTAVDPADIGDICYATLEPKTVREELISFTIDSVTSEGVATLTVTRGLSQKSPYGTGGESFDHQNGSDFVISNNPGLLNHFTAKDNTETVTAQWAFPEPTGNSSPATKAYADALVINGGSEATDSTRGIVRLGESPASEVGICTISIATPAVISYTAHGLVEGDSVKITTTGALPTGLTAGNTYYVISTGLTSDAFQVSATIGGSAVDTSGTQSGVHTLTRWTPIVPIYDADQQDALVGTSGAPSSSNKFITEDDVDTDNTGDAILRLNNGTGISKKLATSASTSEIGDNTTDEIDVVSVSIPADLLGTSNAIKGRVYVTNFSSGSNTTTFRLKYGSTTLISSATTDASNDFVGTGFIDFMLIANGASAQLGVLTIDLSQEELDPNTRYDASANKYIHSTKSGTAAEDSTEALDLKLTIQSATATTDNDFVPAGHIIELIS